MRSLFDNSVFPDYRELLCLSVHGIDDTDNCENKEDDVDQSEKENRDRTENRNEAKDEAENYLDDPPNNFNDCKDKSLIDVKTRKF